MHITFKEKVEVRHFSCTVQFQIILLNSEERGRCMGDAGLQTHRSSPSRSGASTSLRFSHRWWKEGWRNNRNLTLQLNNQGVKSLTSYSLRKRRSFLSSCFWAVTAGTPELWGLEFRPIYQSAPSQLYTVNVSHTWTKKKGNKSRHVRHKA